MATTAFTTDAVAWAVFAVAVSIITKVANDLFIHWRTRRSIAGGLAGEIGAYYRIWHDYDLAAGLARHAAESRADRQDWLRSFPVPPTGHPVFDKVSDRLCLMSPDNVQRASEAYNLVTGMRVLLAGLALPGFLEASDGQQAERLTTMATILNKEMVRLPGTVARLDTASRLLPVRAWRWVTKTDGRHLDPKADEPQTSAG